MNSMDSLQFIFGSFSGAFRRIISLDMEVFQILWLSLKIAITATLSGLVVGIPLGWFIQSRGPRLRNFLLMVFQALLSVPTVIIGTTVYLFVSRRGLLGDLDLLYSPWAILIGDILLVIPLITVFIATSLSQIPKGLLETAVNLGARRFQLLFLVIKECRTAFAVATCVGFGRVISEVGSAMILGGNIRGLTRTLTTSMALEMSKGDTELALALGIMLLCLAIINTSAIQALQKFSVGKVQAHGEETLSATGNIEPVSTVPARVEIKVQPIIVKDLSLKFDGKPIFSKLSCELDLTGGLAIRGKSGVGKTTLLRLIAGLISSDQGVIDVGNRSPLMVFQRPYLFSGTVTDNLTFGLRAHGASFSSAEEKIQPLAKALGLSTLLHRTTENLSGGEAARVSLARALVLTPDLLLIDESLVHLDRLSLTAMKTVLLEYIAQGKGLLLVTHDLSLANSICRHVITIEDGKMLSQS